MIRFKQGEVYGYSECGKVARYSPGGELYAPEDFYRVEEIRELVIYSSVFNGGNEFFYSRGLTGKIHRLSLRNLEKDFKRHPRFLEAVNDLNTEGENGHLERRDEKGDFIINKIYAEKIGK